MTRLLIIKTLCAGLVLAGTAFIAPVQAQFIPGLSKTETEDFGNGLYAFRYNAYRNIFIVTDDGVIATDPLDVKAAEALRQEIAKITDKPVKYVAYSHSHWDHITGQPWNGVEVVEENVLILKPWDLRGTPFHNKTRNGITYSQFADDKRTATKAGETDEQQWIIPSYHADDIIFAVTGVVGGIDVQGVNLLAEDATWMDINAAGRQWAKV